MHQTKKNFWLILGIILLAGAANAAVIIYADPETTWIEAGELVLLSLFLLLSFSWITGKLKWGLIITAAIISSLILRRVGWFGWPSAGIQLMVFGLISLIN